MSKTVTIPVNGHPREFQADYLNPAALEYWHAWLAHEARMAHNPFVEFAAKVQALPEDLRAVATREFVAGVNFDLVPKIVLLETIRSLPAVQTLCVLVTGEDVVTRGELGRGLPAPLALHPAAGIRREFSGRGESPPRRGRQAAPRPACGRPASARRLSRGKQSLARTIQAEETSAGVPSVGISSTGIHRA